LTARFDGEQKLTRFVFSHQQIPDQVLHVVGTAEHLLLSVKIITMPTSRCHVNSEFATTAVCKYGEKKQGKLLSFLFCFIQSNL
jgi:hypothetical protein